MIHSVVVTNFHGESIEIELANPASSGFLITSIDGISQDDATINIMEAATIEGGLFTSSKFEVRSITLGLLFYGRNESVEDARHRCYRYFPVTKKTRLTFRTDNRWTYIEGYVEAHDVNLFTSAEGASITLKCPDPFFRLDSDRDIVFDYVEPLFEFPFSSIAITDTETALYKKIDFGNIKHLVSHHIFYEGEVDTGFEMVIDLKGPVTDLKIYNATTVDYGDGTGRLIISSSKIASIADYNTVDGSKPSLPPGTAGSGMREFGSKVYIGTVPGNKYIEFVDPYNKRTDILGAMDRKKSSWLYLVPGDNEIVVDTNASTASTLLEDLNYEVTLQIPTLFGGV